MDVSGLFDHFSWWRWLNFSILIKFETKYTILFLVVRMARVKNIEADRISNIFPNECNSMHKKSHLHHFNDSAPRETLSSRKPRACLSRILARWNEHLLLLQPAEHQEREKKRRISGALCARITCRKAFFSPRGTQFFCSHASDLIMHWGSRRSREKREREDGQSIKQ